MFDLLNYLRHRNQYINLADIDELPAKVKLDYYFNSIAELTDFNTVLSREDSNDKAFADADSGSAADYLDELFSAVVKLLEVAENEKHLKQTIIDNLQAVLIKVPFNGEYLLTSNNIREQLTKDTNLVECIAQTKSLLIEFSENLFEDTHEVNEFLKAITVKLAGIHGEMNEAHQKYHHRSECKQDMRYALDQSIQEIKRSIDSTDSVDTLKVNLSRLVDTLQTRVVANLESDQTETQALESKILGLTNKVKLLENHTRELECKIRKKQKEAITDPLTGLYNRAAYIQALEKAWINWQENGDQATLLVWDIDHFKMLNDRYGHAAGDKVLQAVANKLKANLRQEDIVARFGGEEFVMLLMNKTIQESQALADRLREKIAETDFTYKKQPLHVTISCGIASFVENDTPTTLFERADKALYSSKRSGRNKVSVISKVA